MYGRMSFDLETGDKISAETIRREAEEEAWIRHLAGTGDSLGIPPLLKDGSVYFAAIDWDHDKADVVSLEAEVRRLGLPLVVCRSKSGGAHLFVFFVERVPAVEVVPKMHEFIDLLALTNPPKKPGQPSIPVEVFPKQTGADEERGNNWINLPYYEALTTTRYAVADGKTLDVDAFLDHAEAARTSAAKFSNVDKSDPGAGEGTFANGPPCLQEFDREGFGEGVRNQGLFIAGVYFRARYPDTWERRLTEYNKDKVDPPLTDSELEGTVLSSLRGKDYAYPFCLYTMMPCTDGRCTNRKYGSKTVARASAGGSNAHHVVVSNLRKIDSDPAFYLLEINAERDVKLLLDELFNYRMFQKACAGQLEIWPPGMKNEDWRQMITPLLDEHELIKAPDEATLSGQFQALMWEFLERRESSRDWEDVLLGQPLELEGIIYFRIADLMKHLMRQGFREWGRADVNAELRKRGMETVRRDVSGKAVQLWSIPADGTTNDQTEDFEERINPETAF